MHLQEVVLGDLTFDRVNELQIAKFHLGWKLYSNIFPTRYHTLNLDIGKASKRLLQNALCSSLLIGPEHKFFLPFLFNIKFAWFFHVLTSAKAKTHQESEKMSFEAKLCVGLARYSLGDTLLV